MTGSVLSLFSFFSITFGLGMTNPFPLLNFYTIATCLGSVYWSTESIFSWFGSEYDGVTWG